MASELLTENRLISLRIGEVECQVPENSSLLRCFEYLRLYPISMGGFCWNADCRTCEVTVRTECSGEQTVLSCQTQVCNGMAIIGMTDKLKFCLRTLTK